MSTCPQEVTRQMLANFLDGGMVPYVFARSFCAKGALVDVGVVGNPVEHPHLISCRLAPGTANAIKRTAITTEHHQSVMD